MATAREIMTWNVECVGENDPIVVAARRMRDLQVGAMPVCGDDGRLQGIVTDRDITVRVVADGLDPTAVTAGELAGGAPVWVDADAEQREVVRLLAEHGIRRLPVIDDRRLVGMISEADVATKLSEDELAEFARAVYSLPPNA
jgi:CBS domain-containing protein